MPSPSGDASELIGGLSIKVTPNHQVCSCTCWWKVEGGELKRKQVIKETKCLYYFFN